MKYYISKAPVLSSHSVAEVADLPPEVAVWSYLGLVGGWNQVASILTNPTPVSPTQGFLLR